MEGNKSAVGHFSRWDLKYRRRQRKSTRNSPASDGEKVHFLAIFVARGIELFVIIFWPYSDLSSGFPSRCAATRSGECKRRGSKLISIIIGPHYRDLRDSPFADRSRCVARSWHVFGRLTANNRFQAHGDRWWSENKPCNSFPTNFRIRRMPMSIYVWLIV